jgi:lysophospholipase L1-like esterase
VHKNTSILWIIGPLLLIFTLLNSCSSPPPESYIILCAGDSITEAGYPKFLARLLREEGIRARVINSGRSGHTSGEYLRFLQGKKSELAESQPDFILLQLGTNDVRTDHDRTSAEDFYDHMKEIIDLFQDFKTRAGKNPRILLAIIPPIPEGTPFPFSPKSGNRVTEEINPLIHKIAAEEKCSLVDNYSVFLNSPHLLPEVHPSDQGYEAMAKNWHNALIKMGIRQLGKT